MPDHLTTSEIEAFCSREASSLKLGYFARHLATCLKCRALYDDVAGKRSLAGGFTFDVSEASGLWNEHPQYEEKVAYANNTLDAEEREIVNDHLATCMACRKAFSAFATSRIKDGAELALRFPKFEREQREPLKQRDRYRDFSRGPLLAIAGMVFVASGAFLIYRLSGTDRDRDVQAPERVAVQAMSTPQPLLQSTPDSIADRNSNSRPAERSRTDTNLKQDLQDKQRQIATDSRQLSASSGLEGLPELTRSYVESILLSGDLAKPANLEPLEGSSGLLRSTQLKNVAVALSPRHEIIRDVRPEFRWSQIPGASSYQVSVADSEGRQVAQSPALGSGVRRWRASLALNRGDTYSWVITAMLDGRKASFPASSEPENRFSILNEDKLIELKRIELELGNGSPLALGIIYAREGLISSAEASFVEAAKRGTDERQKALALLTKVRAWR